MLAKILSEAKAFSDRGYSTGSPPWFRGHCRADWQLKSTLHRHIERYTDKLASPLSEAELRKFICMEYQSAYRTFVNDAWPLLKSIERSEWGVIFTMQHYGLPTRLLDWTESFACALYFSHKHRSRDQSAMVWGLDPQGLNAIAIGGHGVIALDAGGGKSTIDPRSWHPRYLPPENELFTIAVAPHFTNTRMTAQRAAFTLMGDSFLPLNEQFEGRLVSEGYLTKLELTPDTYDDTEDFLRLAGASAFTFFPDMEGLAQRQRDQVGLTERFLKRFHAQHLRPDP